MRDLLYHYTSEEDLKGIIENDNLRATHVRFLNDWTEFREAFTENYVRTLIESFRAELPKDLADAAREVIDRVLSNRVQEIRGIIESSDSTNETFVCSFTSAPSQDSGDPGDRLSQWRGYAHSSQGFSLGFDKNLLKKQVEINNKKAKASLLECIYGDDEKISFFQELGRTAAAQFNELRRSNAPVPSSFVTLRPNASEEYKKSSYYFLKSLSLATAKFFTTAARIKHSGFREECEWRIIFQADRDALLPIDKAGKRIEIIKFRDGQFGRTPFIEIPLGLAKPETSPLRRIVVGPGTHKEDVKRSVELFLLNRGIQVKLPDNEKGVEIVTSLIPYRSG
jgi:hypothetical protein